VQHLERRTKVLDFIGQRPCDHAAGLHAQHGPQPFAAGEDTVAHGLVNRYRMLSFERNQAVQRRVG
jgi:hypothetical protein